MPGSSGARKGRLRCFEDEFAAFPLVDHDAESSGEAAVPERHRVDTAGQPAQLGQSFFDLVLGLADDFGALSEVGRRAGAARPHCAGRGPTLGALSCR